jgi:hypothetical protein
MTFKKMLRSSRCRGEGETDFYVMEVMRGKHFKEGLGETSVL